MSRHLRLAVPTADQDISLAQTVASSDGRDSEAPPNRSRAQIAFDETRVGDASTGGGSAGDEDLALSETHLSGEPRPGLPAPADDDRRMKALIKGRLLRSKATPVKIGRFTVLDRLGEGGMGVVYTAYDDQLERKVAVKVLRGESKGADDLARVRLKREAQAMARLSHPNIVTVHEVSDFDGQIFVAMEFVRGVSLDGWLRKRERPWREVLDVFILAGRGLQAAHEAGIIHRDFKPHNVLVGDDGSVKVLDFGLARASGETDLPALPPGPGAEPQASLLATPLTQTGAIMGTPAYMAPEQHEGLAAGAASDQFAFCVSLYEGLYGQHPFDTSSLAALIGDVLACRVQPPPNGTRVPTRIFRALQRGLAVAPAARHPSMAALLAELARDPEARRRRVLASTGLAVFVGAAGFGAAALQQPAAAPVCAAAADELAAIWSPARGEAVRSAMSATGVPYAADTWSKVQPQLDAYADAWVAMRTEACETHASGHQSDKLFDQRTACLDQRRAGFAGLVDALASADAAVVEKAAQAAAALPSLARCADVSALTADVAPPDDPRVATRVQGLRESLARAKAQEDAGRYATAIAGVDPVLAEATTLSYPPLVAEAALRMGSAQMEAGELAAADASLDRALWTAIASDHDAVSAQTASKRLFLRAVRMGRLDEARAELPLAQALSDHLASDPDIRAEFLNNVGAVFLVLGDPERADASMRAAVELRSKTGRGESVEQAMTLSNLGVVASTRGRDAEAAKYLAQAEPLAQRVLGASHPIHLQIETALAFQLTSQGQLHRARELLGGLLEATADDPARGPLLLATTHCYLGEIDLGERRRRDALGQFERAMTIADADPAMADILLFEAQIGRARVLAGLGEAAEARAQFESTNARMKLKFGEDHVEVARKERDYGDALVKADRAEEALGLFARAEQRCASIDPHTDIDCALAQFSRGAALGRLGRTADAEQDLRSAVADLERLLGEAAPFTNSATTALGELLLERGDLGEAATLLRRAEERLAATMDADHPELASARLSLARALTGDGAASDEARALARRARDVFVARGEAFAGEAKDASDWLAAHGG